MSIAKRRRRFASTRGQQATPINNQPQPVIRAMTSAAPETFVPNTDLIMLGAMINTSPVKASSVEATASSTLFAMPSQEPVPRLAEGGGIAKPSQPVWTGFLVLAREASNQAQESRERVAPLPPAPRPRVAARYS